MTESTEKSLHRSLRKRSFRRRTMATRCRPSPSKLSKMRLGGKGRFTEMPEGFTAELLWFEDDGYGGKESYPLARSVTAKSTSRLLR
jgi:hypothetical protein